MCMIDLGWCMAKLQGHKLTLVCPSDNTDGYYEPSQSITIYGLSNLETLRDELIKAFPIKTTEDLK